MNRLSQPELIIECDYFAINQLEENFNFIQRDQFYIKNNIQEYQYIIMTHP